MPARLYPCLAWLLNAVYRRIARCCFTSLLFIAAVISGVYLLRQNDWIIRFGEVAMIPIRTAGFGELSAEHLKWNYDEDKISMCIKQCLTTIMKITIYMTNIINIKNTQQCIQIVNLKLHICTFFKK